MTVQSVESAAFDEAYIAVLRSMADQVAVAIDNARLFAEARTALRDIEVTQRRYVAQAWSAYQQAAEEVYYATGDSVDDAMEEATTALTRKAIERGTPVLTTVRQGEQEGRALVAPIAFRGQVLGVVGLHGGAGTLGWQEEDIALVEAVVERLGIAADGLRLLEQTQRREARERLAREISARLQAAPELGDLVQTAARELGRELGAEVVLCLGSESQLVDREGAGS
jgi:GAF domain-containing protein